MRIGLLAVVALLQIFPMASSAESIIYPHHALVRVVHVADGDSFVVRTAAGQHVDVRLHAIDAPELVQAHGVAARAALMRLIGTRVVRIACYKRDHLGRSVCRASISETDVELAQLHQGHAWHAKRFAREQGASERALYAKAELAARRAGRGIWAQRHAMPPWTCREHLRRGRRCR